MVITGSPGIGKTWFLLFLAWTAAKRGQTFIFVTGSNHGTLYCPGFSFAGNALNLRCFIDQHCSFDSVDYVFIDVEEPVAAEIGFLKLGRCQIVCYAESPLRYKHVLKHGGLKLCMKMPTEDEVISMYTQVKAFNLKFRESDIMKQLQLFGPIPLYLFDHLPAGDSKLRGAFNREIVSHVVNVLKGESNWNQLSEALLHMHTCDFSMGSVMLKFASKEIIERLHLASASFLKESLRAWILNPREWFREAVGNIFDFLGPRTLLVEKAFTIQRIVSGTCQYGRHLVTPDFTADFCAVAPAAGLFDDPPTCNAPLSPVFLEENKNLQLGNRLVILERNWEASSVEGHVLYVHYNSNMELTDCFMLVDDDLFFFQLTVGQTHPVNGNGLLKIIQKFPTLRNVYLVFVTIEQGINSLQPLHSGDKKNYLSEGYIPQDLRRFNLQCSQYRIVVSDCYF